MAFSQYQMGVDLHLVGIQIMDSQFKFSQYPAHTVDLHLVSIQIDLPKSPVHLKIVFLRCHYVTINKP